MLKASDNSGTRSRKPREVLPGLRPAAPNHHYAPPTPVARKVTARAVGSFVPRLTQPAFEKYGFSAATLITDWATIVGEDFSRYTSPERLKWPRRVECASDEIAETGHSRPGATLFLAVEAGRALDVQYKGRQIVERINAYFGYRAITEMRIVQVPSLPRRPTSASLPLPSASPTPPPPPEILATVSNDDLRAALERMAAGLVARNNRAAASS